MKHGTLKSKELVYCLVLSLFFLFCSISGSAAVTYCSPSAFGYGSSAAGGGSATPVLVSSVSQLQSALNKGKNKVIIITQNLTFTTCMKVQDGSNVTLMGLPGVTLTSLQQDKSNSGILYVKRFNNLVIRNLTFVGPGAYDCDGWDLLCFENVTNAWVDHCDFQDGCDGNFDNKGGTDNVTVSWCRFRYLKAPKAGGSGGSDDHRFTNLLGSSSSDKPSDGTYNITWAYCWWDNGCKERMVRCRNCELHFMNCYWNSSVANYYVGPENAKCYFEGCTFEGKANSASKIFKSYGGTNACKFVDCAGNLPSNAGSVSAPTYSYTASAQAEAKTAVTNATCGAGATLTVTNAGVVSSTCDGGAPLPTVYTVTWDATTNGGTCGTASSSVTSGAAVGSLPEASKDGYTFDGWFTAPSSGSKISSSTTVTGDVTYYAQFTSAPVTVYYTVIWDANGGSCATPSSEIESGAAVGTLPMATKTGDYTFDGWYTAVNGGAKITTSTIINGNVTYYAHYTATGGGGGGCETLAQGTQNAAHTAIDATVGTITTTGGEAQDGYIKLSGSSSQCFVVTAKSGYTIAAGDKLTVTVYNKANSATDIGFTINGTAHTKSVAAQTEDQVVYELVSTDISAGSVTIKRSASNDRYGAILLERCSGSTPTPPTFVLSYDENGGSGTMADEEQTGENVTVAANGFTAPTGYAFQEWNGNMNGGGTVYTAGQVLTLTEDLTIYAIWTPQSYPVTLDAAGGTGGTPSVSATFDADMPAITVPTQPGYVFKGYYTGADGAGTQYYDENGSSTNSWTTAAATTLYAYWEAGSTPDPTGCGVHFWFIKEADAAANSKTNDATVFAGMIGNSSSLNGSLTIDGTSYSVTGRSGDNATFGSFTIPSGKTGVFYALAVSSGSGDRQINLVCGPNTYELPVAGGSDSYKRIESEELPEGTYSIQRDGSSNVRIGVVAVKICESLPPSSTPEISTQPIGAVYCAGDVIVPLSVTATGSGTVTYQWKKDGVNLSGANAASYTPSVSGVYACEVTNTEDSKSPHSITSNDAEIRINGVIGTPTITQIANTVTMTTATAGATIYYTTNGSDPTTGSTPGTSISIVADCTVKAYAVKDGCGSAIASFNAIYDASACAEPAELANEIARYFVPCGLANATAGTAWNVTDVLSSTAANTYTTYKVGGSSNWYIATDKLIYGKLSADDGYIQIKLVSGNFQADDIVYVYGNRNNTSKGGLKVHSSSGNTISLASTPSGVEAEGVYTLTLTDIETDGSLKFFRENSNSFINRIIVTRPQKYSITYDCDGAESGCPANVAEALRLPNPLPDAPVKSGFDFEGWFTNPGKTEPAVADAALTGDVILYAKWVPARPYPTFTWTYESPLQAGGVYPISVASTGDGDVTLSILSAVSGVSLSALTSNPSTGTISIAACPAGSAITIRATSASTTNYKAHTEDRVIPITICETAYNLPYTATTIDGGSKSKPRYYQETANVGVLTKGTGGSSFTPSSESWSGESWITRYVSNGGHLMRTYLANVHKIILYVKTSSSNVTIDKLRRSNSYISGESGGSDAKPGATIVYNNDPSQTSITKNTQETVTITFTTPLSGNEFLYIKFSSSTNLYGVKLYRAEGSEPTTLAWSPSIAGNVVHVTEGDAPFTYAAAITSAIHANTTLTYTSSDTQVATVDPSTGEVTILDNGSSIITATLPALGCFKSAAINYRIEVAECKDDPCKITASKTLKCPSEAVTLTVSDCEELATIQWYKDGAVLAGETGMTLITDEPGEYQVVATKNCHQHSNIITLQDLTAAPTIEAIYTYYYIKDNRDEFHSTDLVLFTITNADVITPDKSIAGCTFEIEDGKVYLRGQPVIAANSNVTLTVTARNSCTGAEADASMELRLLAKTAQPTVAWVVAGTDDGDWSAITSGQGSGNALFDYLNSHGYSLTAVNDYATTNETLIAQYYSQFDIVVMTDFPNSKHKDDHDKSYTNAVGSLIDKKPMLSMEAFVSAQPNWRISSDPYNPSPKQKRMKLLCAAHQIFDPAAEIGVYDEGGEEYVNVLQNTTGTKTLQGFSPVSIPDFIFIATIHDDDHNELVTCCERQTVIQARFMILGIESTGMSAMESGAQQMVKQILDYLLIADPTMIADCSLVFDNGNDGAVAGSGDNLWSNPANWGPNHGSLIPSPFHAVRIERPCKVDIPNAHASSARIAKGSYLSKTYNGSIEVLPQGALSLTGFMKRTYNNDFLTRYPLEEGDITIHADADHNGALIWGDPSGDVPATVEMYSKANGASTANPVWQYIGSPFASRMTAIEQYYEAWMCRWSYVANPELGGTWTWVYNEDRIDPFVGYTITQYDAKKYTWTGLLNNPEEKVLPLRYTVDAEGFAMLANSWIAPINIGAMEAGDFDGAEPTIYIFNTGTYAQYEEGGAPGDATVVDKTGAGQYSAVPVNAASYVGMSTIPPMQGFFVLTTRNGNLTLDYRKIVMDTVNFASTTTPMRTPKRLDEEEIEEAGTKPVPEVMRLNVTSQNWGDKLFLLIHPEFSDAYELGWEGRKQEGDDRAPYLAATEPSGDMAVAAIETPEGQNLLFRAGEDSVYTFYFDYEGETMYLYDRLTGEATEIRTGNTYSFEATNKTPMPRFLITQNPPKMPTGIGSLESESLEFRGAQKMIIDGQLFILRDNRFYDARGVRVTELKRKEGAQ